MKNCFAALFLVCFPVYCFSQDIINTKDNRRLEVKVIEQGSKEIKYLMYDYIDGPVLSIRKNHISSIKYKNGYTDLMGNQNPRKNKPLGVSGGMAYNLNDFGMFIASIDYFVLPQIDLDFTLGTDTEEGIYIAAGTKFHPNPAISDNKLTPFIGISLGTIVNEFLIQFPVGLNYVTGFGLNASASVNYMVVPGWEEWILFPELRIGWRFK